MPDTENLEQRMRTLSETRNFRIGIPQAPVVSPDGTKVYFLRAKGRTPVQRLFEHHIADGTEREVIAPEALLGGEGESLSAEERARRERMRISTKGFASFELSSDGKRMLLPLGQKAFLLTLDDGKARALTEMPEGAFDPHFSNDGTALAYVYKHNVFTLDLRKDASQIPRAITRSGSEEQPLGTADFLSQEELDRSRGFYFSPDDTELLVQQTDNRGVERLSIADPSHPEQVPERPFYPRVGTANPKMSFVRIDLKTLKQTAFQIPADRYVASIVWKAKGTAPCLFELPRDQTFGEVACYTKTSRVVLKRETDAAWVNAQALTTTVKGDQLLWTNDTALSRITLPSDRGAPLAPVAPEASGANRNGVWLHALGGNENQTYASQSDDGLTIGMHAVGAESFSLAMPERTSAEPRLFVTQGLMLSYETSATADPSWRIRSLKFGFPLVGTLANTIEPHALPDIRHVQLGPQKIHAAIAYPTKHGKRIPNEALQPSIIDAAYGGPGVNLVNVNALAYARAQWMADATGAIVVSLDARGTPRRGRDWERAIYKNFNLILEDHKAAIEELAKTGFPGRTVRAGIYGWSFGGYLAAYAATKAPETFAAAFVGAPPADFRDYDTCYTERYLGYPVDSAVYDAASLPLLVANARTVAPIFLVHGVADDNVYFLNAIKLSDALSRGGHRVEFWPLQKTTHMLVEPKLTTDVYLHAASFMREHLKTQ
jgi:dipeptidyl-peptidase 4